MREGKREPTGDSGVLVPIALPSIVRALLVAFQATRTTRCPPLFFFNFS